MTRFQTAKWQTTADPDSLALAVADWMLFLAEAKEGEFSVALSGGSTPQRLFEALAKAPRLNRFPWARTHWFWGDERFVPHADPSSNYHMADEAMLSRAPIPPNNIHAVPTEGLMPEQAAVRYEEELQAFYRSGRLEQARPLFDLVLLGLGADGHTASLFPGGPALDERDHWVAAVPGPRIGMRITLTYPCLQSCGYAAFLVAGPDKTSILRKLRDGAVAYPAARYQPDGELLVFADAAAMGGTGA